MKDCQSDYYLFQFTLWNFFASFREAKNSIILYVLTQSVRMETYMEYFIADTHFYDRKCIGYDGRPFATVSEMNAAMIDNGNKVVKKEDTVYVVGDFSYGNGADIYSTAERLNGKKILIRGNHDNDVNLKYVFAEIHDYLEVATAEVKG